MKMLYKYPQAEFPYKTLADENRQRGAANREFELYDTGAFRETGTSTFLPSMRRAATRDIFIASLPVTADQKLERCTCYPHLVSHTWSGEWIWRRR